MDSDSKKLIPSGTYASRELPSMLEGMVELNKFLVDDQVTKTNKLKGITEITLSLDALDNSDNLKPSNSLLTYYVTSNEDLRISNHKTHDTRNLKTESLLP